MVASLSLLKLLQKRLGLSKTVYFANVKQAEFFRAIAIDRITVTYRYVKVDDRKSFIDFFFVEGLEDGIGHPVYAREGQHPIVPGVDVAIWTADFAGSDVCPADKAHFIIEEDVSACLAFTYKDS